MAHLQDDFDKLLAKVSWNVLDPDVFMTLRSVWWAKVGIFSKGITSADAEVVISFHVSSEVKWDTGLPLLFPPVVLFFVG